MVDKRGLSGESFAERGLFGFGDVEGVFSGRRNEVTLGGQSAQHAVVFGEGLDLLRPTVGKHSLATVRALRNRTLFL